MEDLVDLVDSFGDQLKRSRAKSGGMESFIKWERRSNEQRHSWPTAGDMQTSKSSLESGVESLAHEQRDSRPMPSSIKDLLNSSVEILTNEHEDSKQVELAASFVGFAASNGCADVVCLPNLVESLRQSLSKYHNPGLQRSAASALAVLGRGDLFTKWSLLLVPDLLDDLIRSTKDDKNPEFAEHAAAAVCGLADTADSTTQHIIVRAPGLLDTLALSLAKGSNSALQENAASALVNLGLGDRSILEKILDAPGLLDNFVEFMNQEKDSRLAVLAATFIETLAATEDSAIQGKIAAFPNLLASLRAAIRKVQNPTLQTVAAIAAVRLGRGDRSIVEEILNFPGLLESLVRGVDQDQDSDLAVRATKLICVLAATKDSEIQGKIATLPNLLASLRAALGKSQNPAIQTIAAFALASLGRGNRLIQEEILNFPRLLDELIQLVQQDQNADVAWQAAKVIYYLAATEDSEIRGKIAVFPNLLVTLSATLCKRNFSAVQVIAAAALAELGSGNRAVQEEILNYSGLLTKLVQLVDQDQDSDLAVQASNVIYILAATEDSGIRDKVAAFPNFLASLCAALAKDQNAALQSVAAAALAKVGDGLILENSLHFPGLLDRLVLLVEQDRDSDLAVQALTVINTLAATKDCGIRGRIVTFPNLLASLHAALGKVENRALQRVAAITVAVLARGDRAILENILNFPGLLEKVVKLVDQDQDNLLALRGTQVIYILAGIKDSAIQGKLAAVPNLLASLSAALRKVQNPPLQSTAATALASLGQGDLQKEIWNFPGLLENLVESVDREQNPELAELAAGIILNLADASASTVQLKIASFPNLLETLKGSITKDRKRVLQIQNLEIVATSARLAHRDPDVHPAKRVVRSTDMQSESLGGRTAMEPEDGYLQLCSMASELNPQIQDFGFTSFDQPYDEQRILSFYSVKSSDKTINIVFFHQKGMADLIGVGLQYCRVSIILDVKLRILVYEIPEKSWRAFWLAPPREDLESFQPIILEGKAARGNSTVQQRTDNTSSGIRSANEEEDEMFRVQNSEHHLQMHLEWRPHWIQTLLDTYESQLCSSSSNPSQVNEFATGKDSASMNNETSMSVPGEASKSSTRGSSPVEGLAAEATLSSAGPAAGVASSASGASSTGRTSTSTNRAPAPSGSRADRAGHNELVPHHLESESPTHRNLETGEKRLIVEIFLDDHSSVHIVDSGGNHGAMMGMDAARCTIADAKSRMKSKIVMEFLYDEEDNERAIDVTFLVAFQMGKQNILPNRFGWYQDDLYLSFHCEEDSAVELDIEFQKIRSEIVYTTVERMSNSEKSRSDSIEYIVNMFDHVRMGFPQPSNVHNVLGIKGQYGSDGTTGSKSLEQMAWSNDLVPCLKEAPVFSISNHDCGNQMVYSASLHQGAKKQIEKPHRWDNSERLEAFKLGMFSGVPLNSKARWILFGEGYKQHVFSTQKRLTRFSFVDVNLQDGREEVLQSNESGFIVNHSFLHMHYENWRRAKRYRWKYPQTSPIPHFTDLPCPGPNPEA